MQQLIEQGVFSQIDLFFAESVCKEIGVQSEELMLFLAVLLRSSRQGDLVLNLNDDLGKLADKIRAGAAMLPSEQNLVCREGHFFYLQKNWFFETRFLRHLERLLALPPSAVLFSADGELTKEQSQALEKALTVPFSIISGGPGTGKTFTAARMVRAFLEHKPGARIALAAPTGKAAKQLQQHLDARVETLHALLQVHRESDFAEEPPPLCLDLLIVDECSMIDARLFSYLLSAIGSKTHLVLMGDPHQLPPVETGTLFADLVQVLQDKFSQHLTLLTESKRTDRLEILELAEAIKRGEVQPVLQQLAAELESVEQIWQLVGEFFPVPTTREIEPAELQVEARRFALLSCLRKGPFGVDALNEMCLRHTLALLNKGERVAIPILITRSEGTLCNGETGYLIRNAEKDEYALFGTTRFRPGELPPYEYAYCLSVHKSQGSEYDHVLLIVPPGSENFGREVLYTGATRARKSLKIIGSAEVLQNTLCRVSRKISALHARVSK